MAWPPFGIPMCAPPPEAVERTNAASPRGNTLVQHTPPVACIDIHYESQFRFIQFYKVTGPIPYWENPGDRPMTRDELAAAMQSRPDGWLEAEDQFCHQDDETVTGLRRTLIPTEFTIKSGRTALQMVMGESRFVSDGTRRLIWTARHGTLPEHITPPPDGARILKRLTAVQNAPVPNQWGIRTSMEIVMDPCGAHEPVHTFKTVLVWERFGLYTAGSYSMGMCILPASTDYDNPMIFAGYPRAMGNQSSPEQMEEYPAIDVIYQWSPEAPPQSVIAPPRGQEAVTAQNPSGPGWLYGVRGWSLKNPATWKMTTAIFMHTGNQPNWFLGCQGPGLAERQTEWGFTTKDHSRETMWSILDLLGVSKAQYKRQSTSPSGRFIRWVVIRTTAHPDAIVDDGWKRQSIWLPSSAIAPPASANRNRPVATGLAAI